MPPQVSRPAPGTRPDPKPPPPRRRKISALGDRPRAGTAARPTSPGCRPPSARQTIAPNPATCPGKASLARLLDLAPAPQIDGPLMGGTVITAGTRCAARQRVPGEPAICRCLRIGDQRLAATTARCPGMDMAEGIRRRAAPGVISPGACRAPGAIGLAQQITQAVHAHRSRLAPAGPDRRPHDVHHGSVTSPYLDELAPALDYRPGQIGQLTGHMT